MICTYIHKYRCTSDLCGSRPADNVTFDLSKSRIWNLESRNLEISNLESQIWNLKSRIWISGTKKKNPHKQTIDLLQPTSTSSQPHLKDGFGLATVPLTGRMSTKVRISMLSHCPRFLCLKLARTLLLPSYIVRLYDPPPPDPPSQCIPLPLRSCPAAAGGSTELRVPRQRNDV